jgi:hypothetical protein
MWVRASVVAEGLDDDLFATVKKWLADVWPFDHVAYPGRDMTWDAFEAQF